MILLIGQYTSHYEGDEYKTKEWRDIIAISAASQHIIGLKADGTVVAVGNNSFGQCSTESWRNIVAIATCYMHTIGLKADGTVVVAGGSFKKIYPLPDWHNIVAVPAGIDPESFTGGRIIGLKEDGTVIAIGDRGSEVLNEQKWNNIGPREINSSELGTIKVYLENITVAFKNSDNDRIIENCDQVIKHNINDATIYFYRGLAYFKKGRDDQAVLDLDMALKIGLNSAYIKTANELIKKSRYNIIMLALTVTKNYDQVIMVCDQAITFDPNDAEAYAFRGAAYLEKGYYDQAISDTEIALRIEPNHVDTDAFKEFLEKAQQARNNLGGNTASAYFERGLTAFNKGDFDHAVVDFGQVIKLNPNNVSAYNMRGLAFQYKKNYERSIADFDQAIQLSPNTVAIYRNRSQSHYLNGDTNKAIEDVESVLRLDPNNVKAKGDLRLYHLNLRAKALNEWLGQP